MFGSRLTPVAAIVALSLGLTACGCGSSSTPAPTPTSTPAPTPTPTPTPATYSIGGSVSGLASGGFFVLLNNGHDNLTVQANGVYAFPTAVTSGSVYNVTLGSQPVGQTCSVTNGTGTMASSNVTTVAVSCLNNGESVLYSFGASGTDGRDPRAGLIMDASGNLYGTTSGGGTNNFGTVFKITPSGTETVLHSFAGGADGRDPRAGLIMDASGNLYGTTFGSSSTGGDGTVFKITPSGTETVLHSFASLDPFALGTDGMNPEAGLIMDASGNLYGTTSSGGTNSAGTVFKITPSGTETVLYSFSGVGTDGLYPQAGLIMDASGNMYGTTTGGGTNSGDNNFGTVFKITPSGTETVLHYFAGGADGRTPVAGLVMDASGNLYGTTSGGGTNNFGTVFKITPSGTETVLHSFAGGADGRAPVAGLVMDASGNLYGTTLGSTGTVFKITPSGTETVLHSFAGGADGMSPEAGLVMDASGNMYGTTSGGGTNSFTGTVFRFVP